MTPRRVGWVAWLLLGMACAAMLVAVAGQWAARREAASQADAVQRSIEVHALGLRGAAARYNYLPYTASQHPEVVAALKQR